VRTLTLRIYLTVVAVLLLFAALSGWVFQQRMEHERHRADVVLSERMAAWGELIQRSLPDDDAPPAEQAAAMLDWSERLRLPLALDDEHGVRIATSPTFAQRLGDAASTPGDAADRPNRAYAVPLADGRTLWVMRPGRRFGAGTGPPRDGAGGGVGGMGGSGGPAFGPPAGFGPMPLAPRLLPFLPGPWQGGVELLILLGVLFAAVAAGAWPVVNRLTRRLQALRHGVEQFGSGELGQRVAMQGNDEVAALASSFNQAAGRIETLVRSHQSLLANASHELRSPLARLRMAVSMFANASPERRADLQAEIERNVAELDALVEEVLLASRLDARQGIEQRDPVDVHGVVIEEAARVGASFSGVPAVVIGDERLLRRAVRNLVENAQRYGAGVVDVSVSVRDASVEVAVSDRGDGVPFDLRERIFEPFYRLPGHAEQAGGVGLGLSLVKQIAERHGGQVRCEPREGGGSSFVLALPAAT
jgi:signal transduction histidine kinase